MEARIVRNDSEQNMNKFVLCSAGNSACKHNDVEQHHIDGTRSTDAQSRTSALALLGVHDQEWASPANKSAQSQSPSNDGNEIGSDQEVQEVQQLLELEIKIQEAKGHLRNAQDELAQASSKHSSQSISGSQCSRTYPILDGKEDWHSRVSDENIRHAVHDCSQHDRETQEAYQACKVVSTHICRNSKVVEKVPQPEITQKDDCYIRNFLLSIMNILLIT